MEQKTIGKQFEQELETKLFDKNIIKPWSFKQSKIIPVYLNGTLEDVKSYWNEDARFREGFNINKEEDLLYLPNFFIKINGIYEDKKKFDALRKKLKGDIEYINTPNNITTQIYDTSLFETDSYKKLRNKILNKTPITYEMIKENCNTNYNFLKLNEYIAQYMIDKLNEYIDIFSLYKHENLIDFILYNIILLSEDMYNVLSNWDFPYKVPKVTIFNNNIKDLDENFLIYISYLNFLGFDIIFFSPRGEKILSKSYIKSLNNIMLEKFDICQTKEEYEELIDSNKRKKNFFIVINSLIASLIVFIIFITLFLNSPISIYKVNSNLKVGQIISEKDISEFSIARKEKQNIYFTNKEDILNGIVINDIEKNSLLTKDDVIFICNLDIERGISIEDKNLKIVNKNNQISFNISLIKDDKICFTSKLIKPNENITIDLEQYIDKENDTNIKLSSNIYLNDNKIKTLNLDKELNFGIIKDKTKEDASLEELQQEFGQSIKNLLKFICLIMVISGIFQLIVGLMSNDPERKNKGITMSLTSLTLYGLMFVFFNLLNGF